MNRSTGSNRDLSESFQQFLAGVARLLLWGGVGLLVIAVGFLIYTATVFSGSASGASQPQAMSNIEVFQKIIIAGVLSAGVGSTFLFWGEELLGVFQLIITLLLYFAPLILTSAG